MRRWTPPGNYTMRESTLGDYVLYSDHVREVGELRDKLARLALERTEISALRIALREACDLKEDWLCSHMGYVGSKTQGRIEELRKLLVTSDPTS